MRGLGPASAELIPSLIAREFIFGLFQRPYFQTVPMFLVLPAFLAGKVTLGDLMQVASAFQNTVTTFSWFVFTGHSSTRRPARSISNRKSL